MKDGQFNNYSQENIDVAENLYFANIQHDKDLVWDRIENRLKKKKIIPLWYYYAAASVIIILCFSWFFHMSIEKKNNEIAQLKKGLESNSKNQKMVEKIVYLEPKIDTVKIINEKVSHVIINKYDTVLVRDTVPTFIVKKDTIYIKEKNEGNKMDKKALVINEYTENQKYTSNNISQKKKKEKRFIFKFGKTSTESSANEPQSLLTLKTK
jgi:hypothetical protein